MVPPPKQLVLETAGVCNLRCPQCWIGLRWIDRGKGNYFMGRELFDKIIDEAKGFVTQIYLHLWGEPTLNKDLPYMIKRAKEFAAVDLATHGLFITEELADSIALCDSISVSIDGIDQETYGKYRVGGQLQDALNGLKILSKKKPGKVGWTFVVFKDNEHQIAAAQEMATALGVNFGAKPPVFWDKAGMDNQMPTDEKLRRYTLVNGEWKLKADLFKCREFWNTTYVLPDGNVTTCCYDGKGEYVMGNVNKNTLLEVWNGPEYEKMRKNHDSGILNDMCKKYCQLYPI